MTMVIDAINALGVRFCSFAWAMLLQSAVLIGLLYAVDLLIRRRVRAVVRYGLWMLVLVKLILPPTLALPTGIGYYWWGGADGTVVVEPTREKAPVIALDVAVGNWAGTAVEPETAVRPMVESEVAAARELLPIPAPEDLVTITILPEAVLFVVWLAGVLVLSVLLFQRILFVRSLLAQSDPADGRWREMLDRCRQQVGLRRPMELRLCQNMLSPAACGLFRPVILIPASLLDDLSDEQLRAILIHELAHIKRGDLWVNLIQTLLQIAYFYNPLLWLTNAVVRNIREKAVDEMVLTKLGPQANSYSTTLIDIAERAFARPHFSLRLVGVVESKKALTGRIKHILSRPLPKHEKLGLAGLAAVVIIAAVLLPMAKGKDDPTPVPGMIEPVASPVELKLNVPAGYTTCVRVTNESISERSEEGEEKSDTASSVKDYLIECLAVDDDGTMTIRQTMTAIKSIRERGGERLVYDSKNSPTEITRNMAISSMGLDNPLVMKVTPTGEVVEVKGAEAFAESLMKSTSNSFDMAAQRKHLMLVVEETARVHAALVPYPQEPVLIGQEWQTTLDFNRDWLITQSTGSGTYTWRLEDVAEGVAYLKLEYKSEVDTVNDTRPILRDKLSAAPPTKTHNENLGHMSIQVDLATGLIRYSEQKSTVSVNTDDLRGTMSVNGSTVIEILAVESPGEKMKDEQGQSRVSTVLNSNKPPQSNSRRTQNRPKGLNDGQRVYLEWTERTFSEKLDASEYADLSQTARTEMEAKWISQLRKGNRNTRCAAITKLTAIKSTKAVPDLLTIAAERREKDNRNRWMATRALGLIGDNSVVPDLIHLVYHYNQNTRFWAQISLVRLTGANFATDWHAWGKWWNDQDGKPRFDDQQIQWTTRYKEYADPQKQKESDRNFVLSHQNTPDPVSDEHRNSLRKNFERRMHADHEVFSQAQLQEINNLYRGASKNWNAPQTKTNLKQLVEKYPQSNRAGCAILYLGQMSTGAELEDYFLTAIENHEDCWYGDGVQVGAYARYKLAFYYRSIGKTGEADQLFQELLGDYPDAVNHRGALLADLIARETRQARFSLNSATQPDTGRFLRPQRPDDPRERGFLQIQGMPDGRGRVSPLRQWSRTNLKLRPGQRLDIQAEGQVRGCQSPPDDWAYGPWGPTGGPSKDDPDIRVCALIGRIVGEAQTHEFIVGDHVTINVPFAGSLELGVSDIWHFDNSGEFLVTASVDGDSVNVAPQVNAQEFFDQAEKLFHARGNDSPDEKTARFQEALALYHKAYAQAASNPNLACQAMMMIGLCHERLGNLDAEIQAYQKALEASATWSPATYFYLGRAYERRGQTEQAIATLEKCLPLCTPRGPEAFPYAHAKNALNRLKRERAQANQAPPSFSAKLPNGVTVELAAIAAYPSANNQWWRPDGGPLDTVPDEWGTEFSRTNIGPDHKLMQLVYRIRDNGNDYTFSSKIANAGWNSYSEQPGRLGIAFTQGKDALQTDTRLGIAVGPWRTVMTQEAAFQGVISHRDMIWHEPSTRNGKTVLNSVHPLETVTEKSFRMIAIDRNGQEHTGGSTSATKAGVRSIQTIFRMPLSEIRDFKFQTRPHEWVTFKNVSLTANHGTDVQIDVSVLERFMPTAMPAVTPVPGSLSKGQERAGGVFVTGAVKRPGLYNLPDDGLTLAEAVMTAAPVIEGVAHVHVIRMNADVPGKIVKRLKVKDSSSYDGMREYELEPGDIVEVFDRKP